MMWFMGIMYFVDSIQRREKGEMKEMRGGREKSGKKERGRKEAEVGWCTAFISTAKCLTLWHSLELK